MADSEFQAAGATVSADAVKDADIVLKVKRPEQSELGNYKRGALVIAIRMLPPMLRAKLMRPETWFDSSFGIPT